MESKKDIIAKLQKIFKGDQNVTLINVYKGVPVSFPAKILSVSDDSTLLNVNKYTAICITQVHHTFIRHPLLPQAVRAEVTTLDLDKNLAVLSDLAYAGTTIGGRNQVRVEPEENVPVVLFNGVYSQASLINLSLHGIAVRLDMASFSARAFGVTQKIKLYYRLAGYENTPIMTPGVVKSVQIEERYHGYRLGVQTNPDIQMERVLSRYIAERQATILREIKTQKPYLL